MILLGAFQAVGIVDNSVVVASSADMVTARSVKCLTAPSILVFLFFGIVIRVAFRDVHYEAVETHLITSVSHRVLMSLDNLK